MAFTSKSESNFNLSKPLLKSHLDFISMAIYMAFKCQLLTISIFFKHLDC